MPAALTRSPVEIEDHFSSRDFQRISVLVGKEVGIKLPPNKQMMVEGRLRKRMRAVGLPSLASYCRWLFDEDGLDQELTHLIDAVTTNKTDFFREPEHYEYIEHTIVPDLIKRRYERQPRIKVWSAASSNGAEAYSIAMVLEDMKRNRADFDYVILGTDVSTAMLAVGRRAVYPADQISPVSALMQARYVMYARRPGLRPEVRIVPELRRHVGFRYLNLMDPSFPFDHDVDVIFLRNVLIYFERDVQNMIVARLITHLRPGGYLLLGHSESMVGTGFALRQVAPAIFQKN